MVRYLAFVVLLSITFSTGPAYAETCPEGLQLQQWRQQLQSIKDQFGVAIYTPGAMTKLREKYHQLGTKFPRLFLEQEIRNFPLFGKAACLLWAMNTASGQELNLQPYTDGRFDLTLGGKKIRDRITSAELLAIAKSLR